ncbi:hypothetical protein BVG19_g453 [[Candida] boidinii]|nr:hypothetical protein BVG19_g453 [[Candida] boidinii]OWB50246.1 hypothetical protein B5S27_g1794 [[Candida] boidinii]
MIDDDKNIQLILPEGSTRKEFDKMVSSLVSFRNKSLMSAATCKDPVGRKRYEILLVEKKMRKQLKQARLERQLREKGRLNEVTLVPNEKLIYDTVDDAFNPIKSNQKGKHKERQKDFKNKDRNNLLSNRNMNQHFHFDNVNNTLENNNNNFISNKNTEHIFTGNLQDLQQQNTDLNISQQNQNQNQFKLKDDQRNKKITPKPYPNFIQPIKTGSLSDKEKELKVAGSPITTSNTSILAESPTTKILVPVNQGSLPPLPSLVKLQNPDPYDNSTLIDESNFQSAYSHLEKKVEDAETANNEGYEHEEDDEDDAYAPDVEYERNFINTQENFTNSTSISANSTPVSIPVMPTNFQFQYTQHQNTMNNNNQDGYNNTGYNNNGSRGSGSSDSQGSKKRRSNKHYQKKTFDKLDY